MSNFTIIDLDTLNQIMYILFFFFDLKLFIYLFIIIIIIIFNFKIFNSYMCSQHHILKQFLCLVSVVSTLWDPMDCSMPGFPVFTISQTLLKLMYMESMIPSNHLILCHPLLLLPSVFPRIEVLSNELVHCIRWPKCWSFSISPSNGYSGSVSFKIDWLDLLALQGTLKSPL